MKQYIQVGTSKILHPVTGKFFTCKYSDVPRDSKGWVIDMVYRPLNYDMLKIKIAQNNRAVPGWWTGKGWFGYRFPPKYTVTAWKRELENDQP